MQEGGSRFRGHPPLHASCHGSNHGHKGPSDFMPCADASWMHLTRCWIRGYFGPGPAELMSPKRHSLSPLTPWQAPLTSQAYLIACKPPAGLLPRCSQCSWASPQSAPPAARVPYGPCYRENAAADWWRSYSQDRDWRGSRGMGKTHSPRGWMECEHGAITFLFCALTS